MNAKIQKPLYLSNSEENNTPSATIFLKKLLSYIREVENSLFIQQKENKIHHTLSITSSQTRDRLIDRART